MCAAWVPFDTLGGQRVTSLAWGRKGLVCQPRLPRRKVSTSKVLSGRMLLAWGLDACTFGFESYNLVFFSVHESVRYHAVDF